MNSVLSQFDIAGRSALVTGGASGIGLAYAEALAESGANVTIADLRPDAAEKEAARLRGLGWTVRSEEIDVASESSVAAAFDAHKAAYGGIDITFANAGIASGNGFMSAMGGRDADSQIDTIACEHWQRTLRVNVMGVFHTVRHAARLMKEGGRGGSIVVTSSHASTIVVPIVATAYMAAKAGVSHLVRTVALELAEYRIRVNAIAPGSFVTNIGGGILFDPAVREVWDKKVPLGGMAETRQMKGLALYLASDASDFMTGSELIIDGGVALAGH